MKKLTSIILTLTLLLSVIVVPVYADDNVQTVWGQITGWGKEYYTITYENNQTIEALVGSDNLNIMVGMYAWFTIETRSDSEKYITSYETIPEYGEEVGYLCSTSSYNETVGIYTNTLNNFELSNYITLNGEDIRSADALKELAQYQGVVSYKLRYDCIDSLTYITEPKQSIINQKYNAEQNTFDGLKYTITENTNILYMHYTKNKFTGFDPKYTYSFDVLSYDKDKNARLIVINDMYTYDMGLYEYKNQYCFTRDENGKTNKWEYYSDNLFTNISIGNMIEFTYNEDDGIKSVKALEGEEFTGYKYDKDKNTFGPYNLDSIPVVDVDIIVRADKTYINKYEPLVLDDKLQYSGKVFISSYGKSVIWITGSELAEGNPVVNFWARANINSYNSRFRVGATYEKNGYTGSGTIYLAVYYKGSLYDAYTYSLSDAESTYNEEDDELDSVIWESFSLDGNVNIDDYTVKGFVWYDNLFPMYPAVPVNVKTYQNY